MKRRSRHGREDAARLMGRCLWRERLLAGLSPAALGEPLGIGADASRRYELGEDRIRPVELALIARRLQLPLSCFCPPDGGGGAAPELCAMEQVRRLAVRRPLTLLYAPAFSHVRPLFELWQRARGELTEDAQRAVCAAGLSPRMILVRNPALSGRLITQHFGAGIKIMHPCESLLTVERDFSEHHSDRDYAAWVADAYAETLWRRRPRLDSIRAFIRVGTATTLTGRYDRLIMPWRSATSDWFAMALSIQREAPALSS